VRKWCTLIESLVEAKTTDGYTMRLFITAFTTKQPGQLSKNCYAPKRLEKWVRHRITKMVQNDDCRNPFFTKPFFHFI
jgi:small subunit ribosomal protein S3Ae